jgi:Protein of unknown function (DUF4197)
MKKFIIPVLVSGLFIGLNACDVLESAAGAVTEPTTTKPSLTNSEVISGLKEALTVGIQNSVSLTSVVDGFMNKAEESTKEALPIFKDAILGMSVSDGFSILNGGQGAATKFLKDNTQTKLMEAFAPKVAAAIATVKLTEYWNPIITKYNQAMTLTGGQKLNPDLNKYVTERATDGLFHMVEKEENKIRLDPMARVSDLLSKVFGSIKN